MTQQVYLQPLTTVTGPQAVDGKAVRLGGSMVYAREFAVILRRDGDGVRLSCPEAIRGMIEARGLGLLNAAHGEAPLAAVLDLDVAETERLPPLRLRNVLGADFPLLHKSACPYFAAALVQYMLSGRRE